MNLGETHEAQIWEHLWVLLPLNQPLKPITNVVIHPDDLQTTQVRILHWTWWPSDWLLYQWTAHRISIVRLSFLPPSCLCRIKGLVIGWMILATDWWGRGGQKKRSPEGSWKHVLYCSAQHSESLGGKKTAQANYSKRRRTKLIPVDTPRFLKHLLHHVVNTVIAGVRTINKCPPIHRVIRFEENKINGINCEQVNPAFRGRGQAFN